MANAEIQVGLGWAFIDCEWRCGDRDLCVVQKGCNREPEPITQLKSTNCLDCDEIGGQALPRPQPHRQNP
jgi:hypothetical protein